ncbi:MAG: Ig family protein, partial [Verrucomicrobia bacterium]|nr:Ig family protein [Verrucomicrobiota bacterium]
VFCDVDLSNTSSIECFDAAGKSLGKFYAPVADNGLSFVGVYFTEGERVARVRVTHGNLPLAAGNVDTAVYDVVATDDFMYSEPLPLGTDARLLNISVRSNVGGANGSLIAGFVVGGTQPRTVLVRGVGPGLAGFGVTGAVTTPSIAVFSGSTMVATNSGWANRTDVALTAVAVGAFPLATGSADAAVVTVLNPGAYTLVVNGANNAAGQVLAEVYEVK